MALPGRRTHFRIFDEIGSIRYNYPYTVLFYTPIFMIIRRRKKNHKFKPEIIFRQNYVFFYMIKRRYQKLCGWYEFFNHKLRFQIFEESFKVKRGIYKSYLVLVKRRPHSVYKQYKKIKLLHINTYDWRKSRRIDGIF